MPARIPRLVRVLVTLGSALTVAHGAAAQPLATPSSLDAPLFYQLLIGEIELRSGDAGTAYEVMLDAARRTGDAQLFKRAADIALQARAGDQAMAAVVAWRQAQPDSLDAHRYLIQLLVALNRAGETAEPLASLLKLTPAADRPALINSLPSFFARTTDRTRAAQLLESVLLPYARSDETRTAAAVAIGRAWLNAGEPARALALARQAQAVDPASEGPALLALELLQSTPEAEDIVTRQLQARPQSTGIRILYARVLSNAQRYGDALVQMESVTLAQPELGPPWLTLGALQLEMRRPAEATQSLQTYVRLTQAFAAKPAADDAAADDASPAALNEEGLTQAWLLLAQAAEQLGDAKGAEAWLAKVDSPQRALEVQSRRASLLARQGKLDEARALIRRAPERNPTDARAKLLAEVQLLRDAKKWDEALKLLQAANAATPDDADLLYEQAMMDERLDRLDEMERLLRRVIVLRPDHHHAYNALGYSLAERNMRLPEARALIQKALELAPGEPFITDSLGWVNYRMGEREEALRLLRAAYQSRPDTEISAHLGEVLWVTGHREEARKVWREGKARDAANDVLRETLARLRVDL